MMTLHPNEIKPRYILTIVIFSVASEECSNIFGTPGDIFGEVPKSLESCWQSLKVAGIFRKSRSQQGEASCI